MTQDNPSTLLMTLTWVHRSPVDSPTRIFITSVSNKLQVDDVASAYYIVWKAVPAVLLHQGCPVAVRDRQVVVVTVGLGFNVKCSELQ